jgi:thymidylate synthase
MGRKTWFSIPRNMRPFKNRVNIVLTNNSELHQLSPPATNRDTSMPFFMNFDKFEEFYRRTTSNVFVIGGGQVFDMFLKIETSNLKPTKIYLTELHAQPGHKPSADLQPNVFMSCPDSSYKLISVSNKQTDSFARVNYRYLTYQRCCTIQSSEERYLELCKHVLQQGHIRQDRTGVGTISSFGHQIEFDISTCVPLLTTKRVPWKHVIEELLWFIRGDTDAKILQRKGVRIWDEHTSRAFLDSRGLQNYNEGVLGAGYGFQWRFFGAKYTQAFSDTSRIDTTKVGGVDQLTYVLNELQTNPFSRRIVMSTWNPVDFDKTSLLPCHYSVQFYVEPRGGEKYLHCLFNMRSNDMFLGHPFNCFSYTVLTYILAMKCDMRPGKLVFSGGDVHIYRNHVSQMHQQINRQIRPLPVLIVNPSVKFKDWNQIHLDDFDIAGYFPHPSIKAPMAV